MDLQKIDKNEYLSLQRCHSCNSEQEVAWGLPVSHKSIKIDGAFLLKIKCFCMGNHREDTDCYKEVVQIELRTLNSFSNCGPLPVAIVLEELPGEMEYLKLEYRRGYYLTGREVKVTEGVVDPEGKPVDKPLVVAEYTFLNEKSAGKKTLEKLSPIFEKLVERVRAINKTLGWDCEPPTEG